MYPMLRRHALTCSSSSSSSNYALPPNQQRCVSPPAGITLLQLALPPLRKMARLRQFRDELARCGHDLAEWRARYGAGLGAGQAAALDANGGEGWDLAQVGEGKGEGHDCQVELVGLGCRCGVTCQLPVPKLQPPVWFASGPKRRPSTVPGS